MDARELRRFRQFYLCYPPIWETLSPKLQPNDSKDLSVLSGRLLIERLSFSHFIELMQLEYILKRQFYEIETIRAEPPHG